MGNREVIQCHPVKAWIDILSFIPPKKSILHILGIRAQIALELITKGGRFRGHEGGKIVENIFRLGCNMIILTVDVNAC